MHIIWQGQSCFQILAARGKGEQVSVVIDPFSEDLGIKEPKLAADILLITHEHKDHNNKKSVSGNPFLVASPGEYEVKETFIQGISSFHDQKEGKERGINTIYTVEAEGMRLCHLGDLGQKELTPEQLERIGDIDVLMIPVGGNYTIGSEEATKIISQIEPRIVIPMHYDLPKLKVKLEGVEKFLKAMGVKSLEPLPKFSVKKKDLPEEETKVVLLKP